MFKFCFPIDLFHQKIFFINYLLNFHEVHLSWPFYLGIPFLFEPKEISKRQLIVPNFVFLDGDFIVDLQYLLIFLMFHSIIDSF